MTQCHPALLALAPSRPCHCQLFAWLPLPGGARPPLVPVALVIAAKTALLFGLTLLSAYVSLQGTPPPVVVALPPRVVAPLPAPSLVVAYPGQATASSPPLLHASLASRHAPLLPGRHASPNRCHALPDHCHALRLAEHEPPPFSCKLCPLE